MNIYRYPDFYSYIVDTIGKQFTSIARFIRMRNDEGRKEISLVNQSILAVIFDGLKIWYPELATEVKDELETINAPKVDFKLTTE